MQQAILKTSFVSTERSWRDIKFYLFGIAFALGNLFLPLAVHAIPNGGVIFLPLFFFTLVAAYSEGLLSGILVAILSPVLNHVVTGMPMAAMMPVVLFKSLLVAILAAGTAKYLRKINLLAIAIIVFIMQSAGGLIEFFLTGNVSRTLSSLQLSIPGMILMIVGGYLLLRVISKFRSN